MARLTTVAMSGGRVGGAIEVSFSKNGEDPESSRLAGSSSKVWFGG
jgi:hypothetical protein